MQKICINQNVYEAAKERIRVVFDNFDNVVVSFSGGKDSTVVLNLALEVAREKNRLPLPVFFLDQEGEWQNTIDYVRRVMSSPEVYPIWAQVPFRIFNATSSTQKWLNAWEVGGNWMREKEDIAIKDNVFGVDRFADLLNAIPEAIFKNKGSLASLSGIRVSESMKRALYITRGRANFKWINWCFKRSKGHIDFSPIYDWEISDVWKYIHDNHFDYCKMYDYFFQYGVPINEMRVSNLHHETAVRSLYMLQEIEPDTYQKLTNRIEGVSMASQNQNVLFQIKELPSAFTTWYEYRNYLTEHLLQPKEAKEFFDMYQKDDPLFSQNPMVFDDYNKCAVNSVLHSDNYHTKMVNFKLNPDIRYWMKYKREGVKPICKNKYIDYECK